MPQCPKCGESLWYDATGAGTIEREYCRSCDGLPKATIQVPAGVLPDGFADMNNCVVEEIPDSEIIPGGNSASVKTITKMKPPPQPKPPPKPIGITSTIPKEKIDRRGAIKATKARIKAREQD